MKLAIFIYLVSAFLAQDLIPDNDADGNVINNAIHINSDVIVANLAEFNSNEFVSSQLQSTEPIPWIPKAYPGFNVNSVPFLNSRLGVFTPETDLSAQIRTPLNLNTLEINFFNKFTFFLPFSGIVETGNS